MRVEEGFSRAEEAAASCCNHGEDRVVAGPGNRYGVLGEDAHTLPMGGRCPLRESESGPYGPRGTMPYIKLCSYRGTVVGELAEGRRAFCCVGQPSPREMMLKGEPR